jgi:hypothetical protein
MRRVALALLIGTTVIGLAGGLAYTWGVDPIASYQTSPNELRSSDKLVYLALIGDLYALDEDLDLAQERLAALDIEADGQVLADLLEQHLDGGGRPQEMRNLARLAEALGASGGVLLVYAVPPTPSPEATPTIPAQPDISPTPPPSVTPAPRFQLIEQTSLCAEPGQPGQIRVQVWDSAGNGIAGVEIVVSWNVGQERFFTGLRPARGAGYADFEMVPRIEYDVTLPGFQAEVAKGLSQDLTSGLCPTNTIALDWRVTFQQVEQ